MTDRIANPWSERTPFGLSEDWPVRVDQFLENGVSEEEVDVYHLCKALLAKQCETHAEQLKPFVNRYGEQKPEEPEQLYHEFFDQTRSGSLGLLQHARPIPDGERL